MATEEGMKTALVYSEEWRRFDYGPEHPLRMERLGLTWRLMEAYGLTAGPKLKVLTPEPASVEAITRFHTPEYVEVLRAVSGGDWVPHAAGYGLGAGDNPIFPGLWEAAQLTAGGSLLAAQLVLDGEATRAFHFAGGLHHAMPNRASGFCYVNDAVLAIQALRRKNWKIAYVDIDAHHGDGVQFAFYGDPHVLTFSSHERGDRLFPGTGFVEEIGEGEGLGYSVNLPLQPYTDDAVYAPAFEAVVPPLLRAFAPDAIVLQLGIDSHRTDPLTHLAWTVQGFTKIVARLLEFSPRIVALGGGGYDLPNVARAWTAAWAAMNGVELPAEIPRACHKDLARHGLKQMRLWDEPMDLPPDTRHWAEEFAMRQVQMIREHIFPLHGL
ncbi:MAG: acetoin utilization protein AcuC [Candidatus Rokuibacteriota bacterium]|nr:MAG: acetoin utilization protein AcuC [Candidatus Rokubacteria bacterium]PYM69826.1 MAG: acetoin utilization protein AcuC [Candidatus Rokubacteria bacterium]